MAQAKWMAVLAIAAAFHGVMALPTARDAQGYSVQSSSYEPAAPAVSDTQLLSLTRRYLSEPEPEENPSSGYETEAADNERRSVIGFEDPDVADVASFEKRAPLGPEEAAAPETLESLQSQLDEVNESSRKAASDFSTKLIKLEKLYKNPDATDKQIAAAKEVSDDAYDKMTGQLDAKKALRAKIAAHGKPPQA